MKRVMLTLVGIASLFATVPAFAETGPCMESDETLKVACLNVRLGKDETALTSLQDDVTAAQQAAQAALKAAQAAQQAAQSALQAAQNAQRTADAAIPNGAGVTIASSFSALQKCLWQYQANFSAVFAADCNDGEWWRLNVTHRP